VDVWQTVVGFNQRISLLRQPIALLAMILSADHSHSSFVQESFSHGTAEIIIVEPGLVMAAADSREVSHSFLSDGNTQHFAYNSCKLRRAGNTVVMAAGFVRANDFNALDEVRSLHRPGDELHDTAVRVRHELPEALGHALERVRKVGDTAFRASLEKANALEIALIGLQEGKPGVEVMAFIAQANSDGSIRVRVQAQRCPGDCPNGRSAYFLGEHGAIAKAIARDASLVRGANTNHVTTLLQVEYADRPDIVGGPRTLLRVGDSGVEVMEAGQCSGVELGNEPGVRRGDAARKEPIFEEAGLDEVETTAYLAELDRRIAGVVNLTCHQTLLRRSKSGRIVEEDVVEADLQIVNNREAYSAIRSKGRSYKDFTRLRGAWASGDLVTILHITRGALAAGGGRQAVRLGASGEMENGVAFERSAASGLWKMYIEGVSYPMAFEGVVWFGAQDGRLRSVEWRSVGAVGPRLRPVAEVQWQVDFSPVQIAGEAFVAPSASAYAVKYGRQAKREERTHSTFSGFKRFTATAQLLK
jgi:hypothetical protein